MTTQRCILRYVRGLPWNDKPDMSIQYNTRARHPTTQAILQHEHTHTTGTAGSAATDVHMKDGDSSSTPVAHIPINAATPNVSTWIHGTVQRKRRQRCDMSGPNMSTRAGKSINSDDQALGSLGDENPLVVEGKQEELRRCRVPNLRQHNPGATVATQSASLHKTWKWSLEKSWFCRARFVSRVYRWLEKREDPLRTSSQEGRCSKCCLDGAMGARAQHNTTGSRGNDPRTGKRQESCYWQWMCTWTTCTRHITHWRTSSTPLH